VPDTQPTATVAGQSIALHLTNYPDIPNRWGPGHIRATGLRLDYGSLHTPDTRRATITGLWIREDGQVTDEPLDRDYYAPTGDTSAWPDWIAALAQKHTPNAAPFTPADKTTVVTVASPADSKAVGRQVAEALRKARRNGLGDI
jgi:hypothetical protein